jgi:NitT/TauT family transport system ATP-binding protein
MDVMLQAVSKTYTDATEPLAALAPTTLEIASGEFICFIGPSGCGKSTLLRIIADQMPPTSGQVMLDGATPAHARERKQVAWMAQSPALLPWKTVIENVRIPQVVNRRHNHAAPGPAALLDTVGLAKFSGAYPATLSGGMQQRVALARALATGAPLWLMDEPFAALDELTREQLTEEVLALWAAFSPTVLWVTHSVAEAARLADRVVVMSGAPGGTPGKIRDVVAIDRPRPRETTTREMASVIRRLRYLLRLTESDAEPDADG